MIDWVILRSMSAKETKNTHTGKGASNERQQVRIVVYTSRLMTKKKTRAYHILEITHCKTNRRYTLKNKIGRHKNNGKQNNSTKKWQIRKKKADHKQTNICKTSTGGVEIVRFDFSNFTSRRRNQTRRISLTVLTSVYVRKRQSSPKHASFSSQTPGSCRVLEERNGFYPSGHQRKRLLARENQAQEAGEARFHRCHRESVSPLTRWAPAKTKSDITRHVIMITQIRQITDSHLRYDL